MDTVENDVFETAKLADHLRRDAALVCQRDAGLGQPESVVIQAQAQVVGPELGEGSEDRHAQHGRSPFRQDGDLYLRAW